MLGFSIFWILKGVFFFYFILRFLGSGSLFLLYFLVVSRYFGQFQFGKWPNALPHARKGLGCPSRLAQPASHPRAHKSSKDPPRLHYEPGITFSSSWQHRPPPRAENIAIIFFRFFGHVQMYQMCLCPKFELNRSNNAISSARPAFYSEVGNWYGRSHWASRVELF